MNWQPDARQLAWLKSALFLLGLLPLASLLWLMQTASLGPDPIEAIQRWTGNWALNFLLLTLAISPLRARTGLHWLLRLRRMLGLFVFFYATLHFLSFIGLDHHFIVDEIARDVLKRPFVIAGFAAFVLLAPLAATSNSWAIRQLGGRRWQELHRNIYPAGILAAVHYLWLSKIAALAWPIAYALALAALLAWRVNDRKRRALAAPGGQAAKPLRFFKKRPD